MTTKPGSIRGIETATNKQWNEWVELLDRAGARDLDHTAIAELVFKELDGKVESAGWWAQGVTVAYEQEIGRREPGQRADGTFETSVTKTLAGTKEDVFALWSEAYGIAKELNTQPISNIRTSVTPVRLYWRCDVADGSKVSVASEKKGDSRAMVSVTHTGLQSAEAKDMWQSYWRECLAKL